MIYKKSFYVFGTKISYNNEFKKWCINIPHKYFDALEIAEYNYDNPILNEIAGGISKITKTLPHRINFTVNQLAVRKLWIVGEYLYTEGIIDETEEYCVNFSEMFFPNSPLGDG